MLRVLLVMVVGSAALLSAADVTIEGMPPVPNPFGFDERLALRTYLEEHYHQADVAGLAWLDLVERYRLLTCPPPDEPAPGPTAAEREAVLSTQCRRDNLVLQLERQFGATPDPTASTEELQRILDDLVEAARAKRQGEAAPASVTDDCAAVPSAPVVLRRTPVAAATARALTERDLAAPAGVLAGVYVEHGADRVIGVCFNDDLVRFLEPLMQLFGEAMQRSPDAKTGLLLLGHGDGTRIGLDSPHPVDLVAHFRANHNSYHTLLSCQRMDCVVLLSCSREEASQFTVFRGLGYIPHRRVSAWENTLQSTLSGAAAIELVLSQPNDRNYRAAVFQGEETSVASLAEVGQRAATQYFAATVEHGGLIFTPIKRR